MLAKPQKTKNISRSWKAGDHTDASTACGMYIKKAEQQDDDMKREFPSTPDEAFEASIEGAYFSKQMAKARVERRICRLPVLDAPVYTTWDLGTERQHGHHVLAGRWTERRAVDYYENNGESWGHYAGILLSKGYSYSRHYMPHDAAHRQQGVIRLRRVNRRPIRLASRQRGFAAHTAGKGRDRRKPRVFPKVYIDEERCGRLIQCLDNYRKEWDDNRGSGKTGRGTMSSATVTSHLKARRSGRKW